MFSHLRSTKRAFSVIEMVVTMAIILILTTIVLVSYRKGGQQLALNRAAHKLTQDIRRAQELAMSSTPFETGVSLLVPFGYGIFFNTSQSSNYYLFADVNNDLYFNEGEQVEGPIAFEERVRISDLVSASGTEITIAIVFQPPDPQIFFAKGAVNPEDPFDSNRIREDKVSVVIENADPSLGTRTISVNKAGLVDLE